MRSVCWTGPLEPFVEGYAAELAGLGYTPESLPQQLRLMARLSAWLADQGMGVDALTAEVVDAFVGALRASGYRLHRSARALDPLLAHLRRLGVLGPPTAAEPGPVDALLARYETYLLCQRDLARSSVRIYLSAVRPFLTDRLTEAGLALENVTAREVTTFVLGVCASRRPGRAKTTVTALRSLLRFLHVDGVTARSLVAAVPSAASWRLAPLPRGLEPDQMKRLLAACDRRTRAGRRDYAMLLLLVRLGLRAGEVARLELDDIDWRAAELMVRGKGDRRDRLPLPDDVGRAIAGYLQRGRPSTGQGRHVFLRLNAPHRGLSSEAVSAAVCGCGQRAGLGPVRAHRLRHTAATELVAAGAPLTEVGQLLRHRKALTTAIYAKVDRNALASIARPWPVGAA
jgi:integrase/recombinase XerD